MLYRCSFLFVLANICLARRRHEYPRCGRIRIDDAVGGLQDKVISGHQAARGNFPWLVAILLKGKPYCTGSLISDTQVLTAAHCLEYRVRANAIAINTTDITVVIGRMNLTYTTDGTSRGVKEFKEKFDAYSWEKNVGDVAVLTLDKGVIFNDYTAPICLARNFTEDIGDFGTLAGWGRTLEQNWTSTTISKNNTAGENIVLYRNFSDCTFPQIKYAKVANETDFICAGGNMRMPSEGDDGAPLMHVIEGIWYQVGILSFGVQLHSIKDDYTTGFGLFNRVSSYCPWIEALNSSTQNINATKCLDVPKFDN